MTPTAKMSKEQLQEKLDALQCHFTWDLGIDSFSPQHFLQKLDVEIRHTAHQNRVALLGLQAYLRQLNRQSTEALQSLRAAEEHNEEEEQPAHTAGSLIILGNYAWIHHLQGSYQEAESCLERVQRLCPVPWDVQLIPHVQALKGWSLLAIRAQNGERARECFDMALMLEPENRSFHIGLGMALYSCWVLSWQPDIRNKAIIQLERIVDEQPNNYRAKIYLARLLEKVDKERASSLVEECTENSSDPEVLKQTVFFWMPQSTERAFEIIQKVLQQDPGYHLLYQALSNCYRLLWIKAKEEDKNSILDAAIRDLQQIVNNHPDLDITLVKLQLAEFMGVRDPAREEEIYNELQEQIDTLSLKCRQALNLYWGKFYLYRGGSREMAKEKFMAGYSIPLQTSHRKNCGQRLRKMAHICQRNGDADAADAIRRFLEEADRLLHEESDAQGVDDGERPIPQRRV